MLRSTSSSSADHNIPIPTSSSSSSSSSSTTQIAQSLAQSLISKNQNKLKLSIAIAGGGSSAITTLTSTNSASSIYISGNVLYDRFSFAHYVSSSLMKQQNQKQQQQQQHQPDSGIDHVLPNIYNNSEDNNNNGRMKIYNERNGLFGYCTKYSSLLLSHSSLRSTILYANKPTITSLDDYNLNDYNNYLGIGCTSSLVSQSKEDRKSKVYISVTNGFGLCTSYDVVLDNNISEDNHDDDDDDLDDNTSTSKRRNRIEEENVVGSLILWCIHQYIHEHNLLGHSTIATTEGHQQESTISLNKTLSQILNQHGDSISITQHQNSTSTFQSNIDAANHIIDQSTSSSSHNSSSSNVAILLAPNIKQNKVTPTLQTILPSNSIIFPGSFNPVHVGHVELAKAAIRTMSKKIMVEMKEYAERMMVEGEEEEDDEQQLDDTSNTSTNSIMTNLWNTTEYLSAKDLIDKSSDQNHELCPVFFEMSLTNADKPPMDPLEINRRIEVFDKLISNDDDIDDVEDEHTTTISTIIDSSSAETNKISMPKDWGILLTSAPLFIDKVRLLLDYLAPSSGIYTHHHHCHSHPYKRLMTFVIGTDTMVRIINPKYYDDNFDNMIDAVREMGCLGAHFVVGGRLEQTPILSKDGDSDKDTDVVIEKKFITGEEELKSLPKDVQDMFTIIKEEDFRVDLSSSEIRAKLK